MWHKQQNIDEESEQCHQKGRQQQDQERQQISWRMGGPVEVRSSRKTKAHQSEESRDGVNDEDGRKGLSSARGQIEVAAGAVNVICARSD